MMGIFGTASLVDEVDKRLLVVLRDGRKLIGTMRSFDQFANVVLENTIERIVVGSAYGDIPLGWFIIRGENIVLMGELDEDKERASVLQQVSVEEITERQMREQSEREEQDRVRRKLLQDRGLCGESGFDDLS
eukprot:CAMPEP_0177634972 /NCGR_PEP_ID=MMETSP0447-20121125/3652_1 /TAXON_ID=0 /ORGANISM="Stygamoeba regulata, Strain BSH-02190019" /LENGTH=132 /DNA_ID=CAMNT_0019136727 /DNA_START=214 /DNA_END=612 /DNA_ORIENTATION=+